MWVRSVGREDPLEKEMTTHSSILAWRIPWTKEPCGLQSIGSQESDMTEVTYCASSHSAHRGMKDVLRVVPTFQGVIILPPHLACLP